jgi:hypothetical protein
MEPAEPRARKEPFCFIRRHSSSHGRSATGGLSRE